MAASFPTSIRSWATIAAADLRNSPSLSSRLNALAEEIKATQENIATGAKGTFSSIAARLSSIQGVTDAVAEGTFTPSFSGFTLGSGTESARYAYNNGVLSVWYFGVLGTGFSVGDVEMTVPSGYTLRSMSFRVPCGQALIVDTSTAYAGTVSQVNTTEVRVRWNADLWGTSNPAAADPQLVGSELRALDDGDFPFTWAVGDAIGIHYSFPATTT